MAFVQAQNKQAVPSALTVVTPTMTTTTGNLVVVTATTAAPHTLAITDSKSNTWTAHPNSPQTVGGAQKIYAWYSILTTGGASHTFTATTNVSDNNSIIAAEFSGLASSTPVDASNFAVDGSSVTSHSNGTLTSLTAGDDIVGVATAVEGTTAVFTAGTNWTIPTNGSNPDGNSYYVGLLQYQTNKATASYTNAWTSNHSVTGTGMIWAFKAAAGGPATLSAPTPSGTIGTSTSAAIGATTTQNTGTFYAVIDSAGNLSGVTVAQIKAGQNNASSAAVSAGNASVTTTTASASLTGLTASTGYSYAAVQNNTNGDTNIVTGTFTTAATGTAPQKLLLMGVG